jgi:hypothetical protein
VNNSATVSRVRAVDYRNAIEKYNQLSAVSAGKAVGDIPHVLLAKIKISSGDQPQDALTKISESRREYAVGFRSPKNNLVGGKTYETLTARTLRDLTERHVEISKSIKEVVRAYTEALVECAGATAKSTKMIKAFEVEAPPTLISYMLPDSLIINMLV